MQTTSVHDDPKPLPEVSSPFNQFWHSLNPSEPTGSKCTSSFNIKTPWRMPSSGMLRRVALLRTDISEDRCASVIMVTRIGELGIMLAVASNWHTLWRTIRSVHRLLVTANVVPSWFLSPWWWRRYIPQKRRFLQEPQGITFYKSAFLIATAVKTSNLTY
jgi:hypothetical protein